MSVLERAPLTPGLRLRESLQAEQVAVFLGVYDVYSATLAARHFQGLFVSGYGFAASHYGMPDIGFVAWPDLLAFVQRLRAVLPDPHLMVDIDDGFVDTETACHVVRQLESLGASGVILEDQRRPRRCGHLAGKEILDLESYLVKLEAVLASRRDLFVVARTDTDDPAEIARRAIAFSDAGADAVLVDGLKDLDLLQPIRESISCPLMFNKISGGQSPDYTLTKLQEMGVSLVNYSTPCLFAAHAAIERTLAGIQQQDGTLGNLQPPIADLSESNELLRGNLQV
jgi:2-methylisocitrate lyase-like PEP mutase family enzyme